MQAGAEHGGKANQPEVIRPPSNPDELFVVDAQDFGAGKCTPFVDLDTEAGRMATFRTRWRVTSDGGYVSFPERRLKPLTPKMLAQAGFLYCPDALHTDRCVCFCCNRALHTWDPKDNPLYEHCRVNAECPFIQAATADDIDAMPAKRIPVAPLSGGKAGPSQDAEAPPQAWTLQNGCTWPKDTVIDHLLICVHGVQLKGANTLSEYVETMRKNSAHVAGKYMDDRPMMMAVDAIDWHTLVEGVAKETMDQIMLDSVRMIREMCDDMTRDVMYYTSSVYKYAILDAVAKLLNEKYQQYVDTYPKFTGKVSLFCHALGSVITFDLLWNQKQAKAAASQRAAAAAPSAAAAAPSAAAAASSAADADDTAAAANADGTNPGASSPTDAAPAASPDPAPGTPAPSAAAAAECSPTAAGSHSERRGERGERGEKQLRNGREGWSWPILNFEVDNIFAVGSPIAMFLTVRGAAKEPVTAAKEPVASAKEPTTEYSFLLTRVSQTFFCIARYVVRFACGAFEWYLLLEHKDDDDNDNSSTWCLLLVVPLRGTFCLQ